MGIIRSNAALLVEARRQGTSFGSVLTIGHQNNHLETHHVADFARRLGRDADVGAVAGERYIDRFLCEILGATTVQSLDYSEFEQCDIIHDLNQPVPSTLHAAYDTVIDGGSLEHVFNVPIALGSMMQMVRPGGSLFLFTCANNHLGHGFYQFSPEFFYRTLSCGNGFAVRDVLLEEHPYPGAELTERTACYAVVDPVDHGRRVQLVSRSPVMVMVHAVRTAVVPVFATPPIQSDYQGKYDQHDDAASSATTGAAASPLRRLAKMLLGRLPVGWQRHIKGRRQLAAYSFRNRQLYRPRSL